MISSQHLLNIGCRSTCLEPVLHLDVLILDSSKLQMMGKKNSELRLPTSYGETSMSMMA